MIAPGAWLAVLGGGQLGRMFCNAAQRLGYRVTVLDPDPQSPAGAIAEAHVCADYTDADALARIASTCAAVTTEFENVPAEALEFLARTMPVAPAAASVAIAQDRVREKRFLAEAGLAVGPFAAISDPIDFGGVGPTLFPGILKTTRFGYDGRGQIRVAAHDGLPGAFSALGAAPCVLEQRLDIACEISVIAARGAGGAVTLWPIAENVHRDGILDVTLAPARVDPALARGACAAATRVVEALEYRGVLCVEFFVLADGRLIANEIAPRPHNSGHHTIDTCVTSQFEQQVRMMTGLPSGATSQHSPAVMLNLLGELWFDDAAGGLPREPDWAATVLRHPSAKLHLYGKAEPRRGRKMGHVTCVAARLSEAMETARSIRAALGLPATPAL